ncbi:MAG: protein-L-isoaspartate(D-aspartate) O-methyltransferase [Candidatus Micrarchaeia archaeon]
MNANENERMIRELVKLGYADERVAEAMRFAPRELFVREEDKKFAYVDSPIPIGMGQTISAPSVVAFMSKSLDVSAGMNVLEIGTGSGWQAAILSFLAGKNGRVISLERLPELAEFAKSNLAKLDCNVEVVVGDGTLGYEKNSPYDRIIVTAASPNVPPPLLQQLKEGGKLVIPVGGPWFQDLVLIEKQKNTFTRKEIMAVVFVPLIGRYGYKE